MSVGPVLDRRRFLVAGTAGALAVALVGAGCSDDEPADGSPATTVAPSAVSDLFGDDVAAVADIGAAALEDGAVAGLSAAVAALPSAGIVVEGDQVTVTDAEAFTGALAEAQDVELATAPLTPVLGSLFAPTELAVAVVVHAEA